MTTQRTILLSSKSRLNPYQSMNNFLVFKSNSESKEHILEDSLKKLFPENPSLGSLFYSWMSRHSPYGKVDFETYLGSSN